MLVDAWYWLVTRPSRCFLCGSRLVWHTPRQWRFCCSLPLPIVLTDKGRQLAGERVA